MFHTNRQIGSCNWQFRDNKSKNIKNALQMHCKCDEHEHNANVERELEVRVNKRNGE